MSVRKDILDNIVTTLEAVAGIAEVSKQRRLWEDWGANEEWAKIAIYDGMESSTPRIGCNIYDHNWQISIRVFYKGDNPEDTINDLIYSIRESMLEAGSLHRGGVAYNTNYIGTEMTEDMFEDDRKKASVILNFNIWYREVY